jgi:hypothetical protein
MPAFKNAAEKRAWLLEQLAGVEREALLEDMSSGQNERITIRVGEAPRIEVGQSALYDGKDPAEFIRAFASMIQALPLGSVFLVEAGRGGKVLSGGSADDQAPAAEPTEVRGGRSRTPRSKSAQSGTG